MSQELAYYEHVVLHYIVGDIMHLLDNNEPRSGLILAPVLNGIDIVGGTLYGFERGTSKARSIRLMKEHLGLSQEISNFLYTAVRCGLTHEGTAKKGLVFCAEFGRLNRDSLVYRDENGWLYLDTVLLAEAFVNAAKKIWRDAPQLILKMPEVDDAGYCDLANDASIPMVGDFLKELAEDAAAQEVEIVNGRYKRSNFTSMSLYDPDDFFSSALRIKS